MPAVVTTVSFEHLREPLGIGEPRPRISWQIASAAAGWVQDAYEVEVAPNGAARPDGASKGRPWSSGKVASAESVLVAWDAPPLASGERRLVRVRVWGRGEASPSAWSQPVAVEAGKLEAGDWSAELIAPDRDSGDLLQRPPVRFRKAFELAREIASARLYVTAHGVYEAEINGRTVGDHVLAPGWTSYHHRLRYQTFDVTGLVAAGDNVLGATVAEGWYVGHLGFHGGRRRIWGDDVAFLAQLEVRYADGRTQTIATDATWAWTDGPTLSAGIYAGEDHDARIDQPGWSAQRGDAAERGADQLQDRWAPVRVLGKEPAELVAPAGPPVRRIEELAPVSIGRSPTGRTVVDFGQNLVGRVRIRVTAAAGTTPPSAMPRFSKTANWPLEPFVAPRPRTATRHAAARPRSGNPGSHSTASATWR
jgi:alpha-L-rhamnosidase